MTAAVAYNRGITDAIGAPTFISGTAAVTAAIAVAGPTCKYVLFVSTRQSICPGCMLMIMVDKNRFDEEEAKGFDRYQEVGTRDLLVLSRVSFYLFIHSLHVLLGCSLPVA